MARYDAAVVNGTVVIPYLGALRCDIRIRGGRIAALTEAISSSEAERVVDARGKVVLPGAVDSHFHLGIYRDLAQDARSETASALVGGVTTVVSYFRTGRHYLNKSGPYREIFPEVLAATAPPPRRGGARPPAFFVPPGPPTINKKGGAPGGFFPRGPPGRRRVRPG